jgi:hypothetical protein
MLLTLESVPIKELGQCGSWLICLVKVALAATHEGVAGKVGVQQLVYALEHWLASRQAGE